MGKQRLCDLELCNVPDGVDRIAFETTTGFKKATVLHFNNREQALKVVNEYFDKFGQLTIIEIIY